MVALLVVAVALGLNNFGAAIAIGVSGVDRRTEIKVATVFGLCDVVMPAIGMLIGTGLAGPLGSAARWAGAGILCATAVWGLIEALRGDDDTPKIWHGWRLLVSGAALSLDDLAVGLALGTVRYPIVLAVTLFGLLSFIMSIIGLQLGAKLGKAAGEHGEVVGAIMLLGLSGVMAAGWLLPARERRHDDRRVQVRVLVETPITANRSVTCFPNSLTLTESSLSFSGDLERPCVLRKVILAVDNVNPTGPEAEVTPDAVTDPQHVGDIVGALGTLKRGTANSRSWRRKIRFLLVIMGPGLIVMGGGNDAGGVQVYAQMGQDYGMRLLWTLILLFPILFFCQEMVVRLGAVSGVGHGRLIFARFGKFWGTFSVADLFIINAVTVVAEFIGVEQALSFFGMPSTAAVAASAVLLFAVMAGGTYRYWERFLVVLVIANFVTFPMIYFTHASAAPVASGAVPSLPGGLNATILLLVVAVVGTTVEPWQLFFQQSNVVDKRITPRWMNYERLDTGVGVLIEVIGALVLMAACAFGLAHTSAFGNFSDISSTAAELQRHVGHGTGYLMALATLDGSLIGANLTALTTTYTLGDVYPRMRHSLHWKPRQAPWFYGLYAVLVGVSAVVTLAWGNDLGVVIDGVEALNGILLPSTLVFLILLANDKPVLGPWANSTAQNWVAGVIAWAVLTFSLAPLVTTFFPNVTLAQCEYAFAVAAVLGLAVAAVLLRVRRQARAGAREEASLASDSVQRPPGMSRGDWRTLLRERRDCWRTPALDTLQRPALGTARRIGLLTLRGYILFAIVIVALKLVQVAAGH